MPSAFEPRPLPERGLELVVYDATCRRRGLRPGLTDAWWTGAQIYRRLGRIDAARGVTSWGEALDWLARVAPERPIARVQYWGHGKWGSAMVDRDVLDERSLRRDHPHREALARVIARLRPAPDEVGWWFRTCETFGADAGHRFSRAWADLLGCRVAAHTFVIGAWQSGLHTLAPGDTPSWSPAEGLLEGTPSDPRRAHGSTPWTPRTIHCLAHRVPPDY